MLTKYATFQDAEVLEVKGSPTRRRTASLDKLGDFHDYRTDDGYMYVRLRAISSRVNKNNVSTTVTIKPGEWEEVGAWMWKNRDGFTALAVLPYSEHNYVQAPFEDIDEDQFHVLSRVLHKINLDDVIEVEDNTVLADNLACSGGNCEI